MSTPDIRETRRVRWEQLDENLAFPARDLDRSPLSCSRRAALSSRKREVAF